MVKFIHRTIALAALVAILGAGSIASAVPIRDQVSRHFYPEGGFFVHKACRHSHYANRGYHARTRYGR